MTQKQQALAIIDDALSLLHNWPGQHAAAAVNDIRERIMAIPEELRGKGPAPYYVNPKSISRQPSFSHCPACGEFRGHGHDDICKALTLIDNLP